MVVQAMVAICCAAWGILAKGLLTCGNKGARQIGMRRAAGAHEKVLDLEGIHSQAGAEMAIPHRQIRAAFRGTDHYQ